VPLSATGASNATAVHRVGGSYIWTNVKLAMCRLWSYSSTYS